MNTGLKSNLTRRATWTRGLYMLLFALIYGVAEFVLGAVVIFQFVAILVSGKTNERLRDFGGSLSTFIYQILVFLTFNSESLPFPFAPWPATAQPSGGSRTEDRDESAGQASTEPGGEDKPAQE